MKKYFISKKIFLLSILLFTGDNLYIKSLVILPFTYINNKTDISSKTAKTPNEYFQYFFKGLVYTTINVNNKPLKFHLSFDRYTTYISEKTLLEIDPKSAEIQKKEELYSLDYIGISRAKYANSSFTFLTNETQNVSINNYSFFMDRKRSDVFDNVIISNYYAIESEEIGFNLLKGNKIKKVIVEEEEIDPYDKDYDDDEDDEPIGERYVLENNGYLLEENTNLITQLKNRNYISSEVFMLKIDENNAEKGEIIIGGYPHEYDPKHYSEKFLIQQLSSRGDGYGNWDIIFQDIQYNKTNYVSIKAAEISPDFGFILATGNFFENLNKSFFNDPKYVNSCFEETIDKYIIKYCEENVIKQFPNISFVLSKDYINRHNQSNELEFDYKDLFVKAPGNNNLYYFQIVFKTEVFDRWKLGLSFLKKYPVVFDRDSRMIGFYKETGDYVIDGGNNKEGKKFSLSLSWILVIILSIILIFLIYGFFKILPSIRRKKKANELEDDYEYNVQENKIN